MNPAFSTSDIMLTIALSFAAIAIAGATALAIFWPLTAVHLRDRHLGWRENYISDKTAGSFSYWKWFLSGDFAKLRDPNLNGLARPMQISLWTIIGALICGALLWLVAEFVVK